MLFVVVPVEEFSKFLAVRLGAYRSLHFDEPGDGPVYAAAASLGFASIENLGYVLAFGPAAMILRAPLSTAARVVFGGFWGYALGLRAGGGDSRGGLWVVAVGLLAASAAHGVFNIAVSTLPLAAVALTALGVWWTLSRFDWARRGAPFRYRRNYPKIACAACGRRIAAISRFRRFRRARVAGRRQAAPPSTADDAPPQAGRTPPTAPPQVRSVRKARLVAPNRAVRRALQDGEAACARSRATNGGRCHAACEFLAVRV